MDLPKKKLEAARAGKGSSCSGREGRCPNCKQVTDGDECWNCVPAEGASDEEMA